MAITFSVTTIVLTLIALFVFRSVLKQASTDLPRIAGDGLHILAVTAKAVDENAMTLASENAVELRIRMKELVDRAEQAQVSGIDIRDEYARITGQTL